MVLLPVFYSYKIKACFLFPKSIKYCKNEQSVKVLSHIHPITSRLFVSLRAIYNRNLY